MDVDAPVVVSPHAALSDYEPPQFTTNARVLCYHGPLIYEAKVTKTAYFVPTKDAPQFASNPDIVGSINKLAGRHYFVHYKGWKQTWDEWVSAARVLRFDEQGMVKQKELMAAAPRATQKPAVNTHKRASSAAEGSASVKGEVGKKKEVITLRGVKRGRDEVLDDPRPPKPNMVLVIPELLKAQLVDDWECITKNKQLVPLPRSPTVEEIISDWEQHTLRELPAAVRDPASLASTMSDGLKTYFVRSIAQNLLYRDERPQYADIQKEYLSLADTSSLGQKDARHIYGAEHLLRMLVSLPQIVAHSAMDKENIDILAGYVNYLLKWIAEPEQRDRMFLREYEDSSIAYQNVARS